MNLQAPAGFLQVLPLPLLQVLHLPVPAGHFPLPIPASVQAQDQDQTAFQLPVGVLFRISLPVLQVQVLRLSPVFQQAPQILPFPALPPAALHLPADPEVPPLLLYLRCFPLNRLPVLLPEILH